jgi:2,3-bisphosphoglycerate-independent phosphoglycerate mutase
MDRDNRWDRVEQAYHLMTEGHAAHTAKSVIEGLEAAYSRDENDEFVQATAIIAEGESAVTIEDGDAIISMNFRPDRAREITHALVDEQFDDFNRQRVPSLSSFVMTTEYEATLNLPCAYPPENLVNSLGEYLANQGKQQLRIAETEKYAHVTFFFSGGREALYNGEERTLIPSPDVETYDQKPEMSAFEVTEKLVDAINSGRFDTIICNYANCDQVGHTGDFDASVKAVEAVDSCLKLVLDAAAAQQGEVLITADHGNVEEMFDEASNQPHTQHTTLPVPLVYAGPRQISLDSGGSLADIAPTILDMMGLDKPAEMSGRSLIR